MQKNGWLIVVVSLMLSCGCMIPVKYPINDIMPVKHSPYRGSSLVVLQFDDICELPAGIGNAVPATVINSEGSWFYNNYGSNRYKLAYAITKMITTHLEKTEIFLSVVPVDAPTATPVSDYILCGKIKKFDSFLERKTATQAGQYLGVIGALSTMGVQGRHRSEVILVELRLLKAGSNEPPVWKGSVKGEISGKCYADPNGFAPYSLVSLALKEAVNELVLKLQQVEKISREQLVPGTNESLIGK